MSLLWSSSIIGVIRDDLVSVNLRDQLREQSDNFLGSLVIPVSQRWGTSRCIWKRSRGFLATFTRKIITRMEENNFSPGNHLQTAMYTGYTFCGRQVVSVTAFLSLHNCCCHPKDLPLSMLDLLFILYYRECNKRCWKMQNKHSLWKDWSFNYLLRLYFLKVHFLVFWQRLTVKYLSVV